ncbi:MAG TPA: 6-pyruvoyl-tetrahydropterin synthase-related protein, partial [Chloroflexota bacterium]
MSTLIRKRPAPLWALLLPLACFAAAPLVRGPIFSSSDGILHLYQLIEFDAVLRAGVPFPRWAPDLLSGYGYPQMIFYAPLMYYLASAFHFVGLGYVDALKATVLAGMVASEAGMFVLGRELWGRWGGLLAAVAYLYFPYRLVNTYLDGELSQTLAWAWLPGLVWACWRFLRSGGRGHWLLAAACWAGLIYTHSVTSWLTAMFLGLLLLAWLALREARLLDELYLVGALALGTGLAAPYWLPALAEAGFVQLGRVQTGSYDFHVNLLPLGRVLSTELAHGYSGYVGANGPAQLGLLQLLAGATGLVAGIAACRGKAARLAAPFAALSLVAIVLMLEPAAPFWEHVPFGSALQFPDRLLGMLGFLLAVLAGAAGLWLRRLPTIPAALLAVAACAALIYAATARLNPAFVALPSSLSVADAAESDQSTGAIATTAKGEYTPIWMPAPLATSPLLPGYLTGRTPSIAAPGGAEITLLQHAPSDVGLAVSAPSAGIVELPVTYYPGWTASRSGATVPVEPSKRGLIAVDLPAGQSDLQLHFGSTSDRRLATA